MLMGPVGHSTGWELLGVPSAYLGSRRATPLAQTNSIQYCRLCIVLTTYDSIFAGCPAFVDGCGLQVVGLDALSLAPAAVREEVRRPAGSSNAS